MLVTTCVMMAACLISMSHTAVYANSARVKSIPGNAVDGSLVITTDTTLEDLDFAGNVYIPKETTLTLTGTANITGSLYIFGTVNNNAYLNIGETMYCLHYGSMMSAGGDYDYGYFNNYGKVSADTLVVNPSYLSVRIPDVSVGVPTTPVEPPNILPTDPSVEEPSSSGTTEPSTENKPPVETTTPLFPANQDLPGVIPFMKEEVTFLGVFDRFKTYGDDPFNLEIYAKTTGAISYSSDDTSVATVSQTGTVTITGIGVAGITITTAEHGGYMQGEDYLNIRVKPKTMAAPKLKSKKKGTLTVKWKKDVKSTGYQVVVAKDKKFKKIVKTATVKKNKTTSKTFKKLKKKKTYYVRIRPYKNTEVGRIYGNYSKAKKCKIK